MGSDDIYPTGKCRDNSVRHYLEQNCGTTLSKSVAQGTYYMMALWGSSLGTRACPVCSVRHQPLSLEIKVPVLMIRYGLPLQLEGIPSSLLGRGKEPC